MGAAPVDGIHDSRCILRVLRHRARGVGLVGESGATLVKRENVKAVCKAAVEDVRLTAQITANATEVQHRAAASATLVMKSYIGACGVRHNSFAAYSLSPLCNLSAW